VRGTGRNLARYAVDHRFIPASAGNRSTPGSGTE